MPALIVLGLLLAGISLGGTVALLVAAVASGLRERGTRAGTCVA